MSLEALSPDATTQPRGTMADSIYTQLRTAILELRLLPGVGISEAEVARHLGVSRQPVREAFGRLARTGYLRVQPQRRTEVVKISVQEVRNARFIRGRLTPALRQMKYMPEVRFRTDTSFDNFARIDALLKSPEVARDLDDEDDDKDNG